MEKALLDPRPHMFPNPVVLVTCGKGGETNIITLAWAGTVCGAPPMVSISVRPATHSHGLLRRHGEFVVNFPTVDQLGAVIICGLKSGRDCDKWAEAGLHPDPSDVIQTPGIAECPVSLECRVKHTLDLGQHTLFVGEVVRARRDLSWKGAPAPIAWVEGKYYGLSEEPLR